MSSLEATAYNRLFYRLKVQALIQDLRTRFGEDQAWDIVQQAITLEAKHRENDDRSLADHRSR